MTTATLTGSPKQVEWAERIRAEKLEACEKHIARMQAGTVDRLGRPIAPKPMTRELAIVAALCGMTEASYWIDRKDFNTNSILMDGYDLIPDVD